MSLRADRLVLASVKSFFGSRGVVAPHVDGSTSDDRARRLYRLFNDVPIRDAVIAGAAERYGYTAAQVRLRLYAGRFAGPTHGVHEQQIRNWCAAQHVGGGPIEVYGVSDVISAVRTAAASKSTETTRSSSR